MNTCISCSMPLDAEHGFGNAITEGQVCQYCAPNGKMESCATIFEGGVQFFMSVDPEMDRIAGERITRRNMKNGSYWKAHPDPVLEGEEASDEEFFAVLSKL